MSGQKKRGRPPLLHSQGGDDVTAGLKGKAVLVPSSALAALASVHGHGRYLHGIIKGKDSGRQGCVLIKCKEDPRTFYFDAGQVQSWLEMQEEGDDVQPREGLREQHGREKELQNKRTRTGHTTSSSGCFIPNIDLTAGNPRSEQNTSTGPPKKGYTTKAEVADLTDKEVDIPGSVFQNHTPGLIFRAYVMGPDSSHASAVVLRLLDVPRSRYYFHASEVREWLQATQLRAPAEVQPDTDEAETQDELLVAEALACMPAGGKGLAPSPFPSIDAEQPVSTQPAIAPTGYGYAAASSGMSRHLSLGPLEPLAQTSSLLPPRLAEQLSLIAGLHSRNTVVSQ